MIRRRGEGAVRERGGGGGGGEGRVGAGSSRDARDGGILLVGDMDARCRLRPREGMSVVRHGRKSSGRSSVVRMRVMMTLGHMPMDGRLRLPAFPLDLGGGVGEHVDIEGVPHDRPRAVSLAAPMQRQHGAHVADGGLVGIRRGDVGRAHGGGRSGLGHGLRRWHHHRRGGFVRVRGQGGHMM